MSLIRVVELKHKDITKIVVARKWFINQPSMGIYAHGERMDLIVQIPL